MISKETIERVSIFIVMTSALTFGSFVILNGLGLRYAFRTYIIVPFVTIVIIWCTGHKKVKYSLSGSIEKLYFLFCLLTFISGIANFDVYTIVSSIIGILLFFAITSIPYERLYDLYTLFVIAYVLSCIIVFRRYTVSTINSEGVIFSFLGVFILNLICKSRFNNYFIYFAVSAIVIFLIMMTKARTPLAAFIVVDIVTYFYLFAKKPSIKKLLVLVISLVAIYYVSDMVIGTMNQYFLHKWRNQDLSSGRQTYWKIVFDDLQLFGNGMGEGSQIKNLGFNAHNSWVQTFGSFGVLSGLAYIMLTIASIISIKISKMKIIHINFFCGWLVISMFEDLSIFSSRYIPIVFAFLIHIFMLAKEQNLDIHMNIEHQELIVR